MALLISWAGCGPAPLVIPNPRGLCGVRDLLFFFRNCFGRTAPGPGTCRESLPTCTGPVAKTTHY
jgi:hypothetical protein